MISLECGRVGRFVSADARGGTRLGMLEILNGLRALAALPGRGAVAVGKIEKAVREIAISVGMIAPSEVSPRG